MLKKRLYGENYKENEKKKEKSYILLELNLKKKNYGFS